MSYFSRFSYFRQAVFVIMLLVAEAVFAADTEQTSMAPQQVEATVAQPIQISDESRLQKAETEVKAVMNSITPDNRSALEERLKEEQIISSSLFGITFYKPTYILPFYYTGAPDQTVYRGNITDNQNVQSEEFKAQFSIKFPVFTNMFSNGVDLNMAYTQMMYWQFYARSQYFRETDYEPEIFLSKKLMPNWWAHLGIEHQSNGRGGDLERSWNRAYANLIFANDNWAVNLRPWVLIFQGGSSNLHNRYIADYMGHGEAIFSYTTHRNTFSLMLRNHVESGFKRGALEFDYSFPLHKLIKGYIQVFSGYGQSLIEYNHYTKSVGVGIALSDWI